METEYRNRKIPVPPEFADVFSHFYEAVNDSPREIRKTLLPSFQTIIVFSFGAGISFSTKQHTTIAYEKCLVLGPIKKPIDYTLPPCSEMLVANFNGDAFYRFFGQAIVSEHVPIHPDQLVDDDCFTNLWCLLKKKKTADDRVNMILDFCRPYLRERDVTVKKLIDFGADERSTSPIKAIAEESNVSERAIQSKYKKYLGFSAKEITRYKRFMQAIELSEAALIKNKKVDWLSIINECGYYDQSQLIHDFKHFLNLSPMQYVKFQEDVCIMRPE